MFHYQTGGPGGQHRNKTASAVRLRHRPSGLEATATERRSQHENKANALWRLREAIAVHCRLPVNGPIAWPDAQLVRDGRLNVGRKNPSRNHVIAIGLDVFAAAKGRLSDAAALLGVTSSSLTSFLAEHPKAWAEANRIRQTFGLSPLRA